MAKRKPLAEMGHPMQPIGVDTDGVIRFRENAVAWKLLDWAKARGVDLGELIGDLPDAELEHFFQLVGFSIEKYNEVFGGTKSAAAANYLAAQLRELEGKK